MDISGGGSLPHTSDHLHQSSSSSPPPDALPNMDGEETMHTALTEYSSPPPPASREPLFLGNDEEEEEGEEPKPSLRITPDFFGHREAKQDGKRSSSPMRSGHSKSTRAALFEEDDSPTKPRFGNASKETPEQRRKRKVEAAQEARKWTKRYIGSFMVPGWSTTRGVNLVRDGDVVDVWRDKGKPPPSAKGKGKQQQKLSFGRKGQTDQCLVRFSTKKGECVGC